MSQVEAIALEALRMAGDPTPLRGCAPVGGGMISQAARITTERSTYLLKCGGQGLPEFFTVEARGLALLASAGALRVPAVLAWRDPTPTNDQRPTTNDQRPTLALEPFASLKGKLREGTNDQEAGEMAGSRRSAVAAEAGFILLEWLATSAGADRQAAFAALGRSLAQLHRTTAPAYGLDHDNYIGLTPQLNGWTASWTAFFRERRLRPQAELARRNGWVSGDRARRLERLLDRLDTWLDDDLARPALLHGDLWDGNVLIGQHGAPALIDPAVYYGDREAEIAHTAMFDGFPEPFYRAYEEAWPLPDGWRDRRDILNLYHLLNHLNHFGESYAVHVDRVLRRYVG